MASQVAIEVQDHTLREGAAAILEAAPCAGGRLFMRVLAIGPSLSITIATLSAKEMAGDTLHINCRKLTWASAGIRKQPVERGTGYQVPQGTFAAHSRRLAAHRGARGDLRLQRFGTRIGFAPLVSRGSEEFPRWLRRFRDPEPGAVV